MKTNWWTWVILLLCAAAIHQRVTFAATNTPTSATSKIGKRVIVEPIQETRARAEKGDADAQHELGLLYFRGEGVPKDRDQGIYWLTKAAENGNVSSQTVLASTFRAGTFPFDGAGRDFVEAAKWYKRAAAQGDADAQLTIGEMYGKGEGVMQDFVEAYKWFNIAATSTNSAPTYASSGVVLSPPTHELTDEEKKQRAEGLKILAAMFRATADKAREARTELASQMTPVQIAEAQRLARQFRPRMESGTNTSTSAENPIASGTGFFITEDGFLVTNEHVVRDAAQVRLVTSAGLISAKVVKVDAANDLALLKAEGRFAALPVTTSRGVKLGCTVATVGFPNIGLQGFAPKLAKGEIASLSGAGDDARYFQISVPVQPGNSGGALVDERGNVVGVVSAKLSAKAALAASGSLPENVNYAVKSSYLLSFLESVPEVSAKLKEPETKERKFEDVVKSAEQAAVLVLVY